MVSGCRLICSGGTEVNVDDDCFELRSDAIWEETSAMVVMGAPSIAIRVIDRSVDCQRGTRCADVEGIHDWRLIRLVSLPSLRSRPRVG